MTSSPRGGVGNVNNDVTNSPRLTLHIPNSYPRSTSPRSSPILGNSPSSRSINIPDKGEQLEQNTRLPGAQSPTPSSSSRNRNQAQSPKQQSPPTPGLIERRQYGSISNNNDNQILPPPVIHEQQQYPTTSKKKWDFIVEFFTANNTTGESARDFLARERTFFSWLRLSSTLAIGSAALFLRLQLKDLSQVVGKSVTKNTLRRQALQKYLQTNSIKQAYSPPPSMILKTTSSNTNILDTSIALSKALGILFFLLALFSLAIGWIDYIRCIRALEHADETVPIFPSPLSSQISQHAQQQQSRIERGDRSGISISNADDDHPRHLERRAVAQKWHDARHARQAHSAKIVHITEIIVAVVIFGTALTILLTNNGASIAPLPPNEDEK